MKKKAKTKKLSKRARVKEATGINIEAAKGRDRGLQTQIDALKKSLKEIKKEFVYCIIRKQVEIDDINNRLAKLEARK